MSDSPAHPKSHRTQILVALISAGALIIVAVLNNYRPWFSGDTDGRGAQPVPVNRDADGEVVPLRKSQSAMVEVLAAIDTTRFQLWSDSLRTARQLRRLDLMESGREMSRTPAGTFFFIFYAYLEPYGDSMPATHGAVSQYDESRMYVEIHHTTSDQYFMLVFASPEGAARVVNTPVSGVQDITVFASPRAEYRIPVLLPFERVVALKGRYLRPLLTALDISVR